MNLTSILIVEDDIFISDMIKELLIQNNYKVSTAYSGTEALLCLEKNNFNLIILDLMLPGLSGEEVLSFIRKTSITPIIGVSAKDDIESKVNLLRNGADDYITKPFNNEELLARIDVLLRRNTPQHISSIYKFKNLTLDSVTFEIKVLDIPISLTKREYLILKLLLSNPKKVFTKNNIYESVWNESFVGEENAVNVHISNIRQKISKIDEENQYIETVWGIGFKMKS